MPKPEASLSAVVVSGGKQYRVAPGDRILVDRLSADPGSSIKLERILMVADGDDLKLGSALEGLAVEAKVVGHPRGPRLESLRYKSKKRVRVHHGGRSHLTALEIIAVAGVGVETAEAEEEKEAKPKSRGRGKAAPRAPRAPRAKAAAGETPVATAEAEEAPKKPARRRTKKDTE